MKWWKAVTALLFLIQLTESLPNNDHVIYATPDGNPGVCPEGKHCTTLQKCIEIETSCFKNQTKIILLGGNHTVTMSDEHSITLHDLHNFTMIGDGTISSDLNTPPDPNITIICKGSIGFHFRFCRNLNITNLAIENCGANISQNEYLKHIHAAVSFFVVTDLTIESVSIKNSAGFGIHADKAYGIVTISHSIFSGNKGYLDFYGGNAHLWYKGCRRDTSANVTIRYSWFVNSTNSEIAFANNSNATGLEVMVDCPHIRVQIQNIIAKNNTASKGGNLAIAFVDRHNNTAHVSIQDSHIEDGSADRGGGLTVWSEIDLASNDTISCGLDEDDRVIIEITNTDFTDNYANKDGGALYVGHYERGKVDCIVRKIKFVDCTFLRNKVNWLGSGAAALITKYEMVGYIPHPEPQFEVGFHNCTFTKHYFDGKRKNDVHLHGIINALSVGKLLVSDSRFTDNNSTAISLLSSNLILEGDVLFQDNTAYNGGALEFCTSSAIIIKNNTDTNVMFINNHALKTGGAIYAQEPCLDTVPACFFQPVTNTSAPEDCESLHFTMSLTFINNTAGEAGDAIFNGAIDYCYLLYNHHIHLGSNNAETRSKCTFDKIFNVSQQIDLNNTSYISSEPQQVCLCPDYQDKNCSMISYTYPREVFPGEMFNISAIAVGQRLGIVPAVVEVDLVDNDSGNHTLSGTTVVKSGKQCTNLTVAVGSNSSSVLVNLSVQAQNWKYTQQPQVNITLAKCPMGFTKEINGSKTCICDEKLRTKWRLSCNGDSFKYTRLEPLWIGCDEEDCLLSTCTYDYCNLLILNQEDDLNIEDDKQCNFNRAGRVCGACKTNYSVVLGSSRCLQCSNTLLGPLLVAFALAGIALFVFLFIFNFTVTEGTISGFIMYANIIHLNHKVFFPGNKVPPLSVLIAWFNLDLGIETCFFEGMDDYTKLWLQFGFIAYIWSIGGLIILLSRKYIFVTRLFGRNATKVLATLFLLSFTNVVRNISKSVSFTLLQDIELNIRQLVCDFDGNVVFLHQKHIPLYIFACLLVLIFTFFATALTFIQCLQRSSFRPLRWVEKFRPFFEAFTGPCRDNYRFWPGLLLMCRAILIVLDSVYHNPQDSVLKVAVITAVCMFLLCLACVTPKGVYKKWQLNVLECSFFLNIIVTCIVLLVDESIKKNLIPFSYLHSIGHLFTTYMYCSISIAVLTLTGILIFHAYTQLKTSRLTKACIKFIRQKRQRTIPAPERPVSPQSTPSSDRPTTSIVSMEDSIGESLEDSIGESTHLLAQSLPPVVRYHQYREPLIADDD